MRKEKGSLHSNETRDLDPYRGETQKTMQTAEEKKEIKAALPSD